MSARKLPFIVQPKTKKEEVTLGTDDSGQIKVEHRGYVTVGEKALTQEAMKGSYAVPELYQFVRGVAVDSGKDVDQVFSDLSTSPLPDYLIVWEDEIVAHLEAVNLEVGRRKMIYATAILISRVDDQWSIEDTMQLHPELVEALSEFYIQEENGAESILEDAADNTGAEGKE